MPTSKSRDLAPVGVQIPESQNGSDEAVTPLDYAEIHDAGQRRRLEQYELEAQEHRSKAAEHVAGFARAIKAAYEDIQAAYTPGVHTDRLFVAWAARLGVKRTSAYRWIVVGEHADEYLAISDKLYTDLVDNVSGLALLLGAGPLIQEKVIESGAKSRRDIQAIIDAHERDKDELERLRREMDDAKEREASTRASLATIQAFCDDLKQHANSDAAAKYQDAMDELQATAHKQATYIREMEERWEKARDIATQRAKFDVLGEGMLRQMKTWIAGLPRRDQAAFFSDYEHQLVGWVRDEWQAVDSLLVPLLPGRMIEGSIEPRE